MQMYRPELLFTIIVSANVTHSVFTKLYQPAKAEWLSASYGTIRVS
jgi:hypothetical protein